MWPTQAGGDNLGIAQVHRRQRQIMQLALLADAWRARRVGGASRPARTVKRRHALTWAWGASGRETMHLLFATLTSCTRWNRRRLRCEPTFACHSSCWPSWICFRSNCSPLSGAVRTSRHWKRIPVLYRELLPAAVLVYAQSLRLLFLRCAGGPIPFVDCRTLSSG